MDLKERVQGETAGTGMHLGSYMKTYCSGKFEESMRVTLVRTSSNGGCGVSTGHYCSQAIIPIVVLSYLHFICCLKSFNFIINKIIIKLL